MKYIKIDEGCYKAERISDIYNEVVVYNKEALNGLQ